ncbi:hypothetical protein CH337_20780 [Rhodoblastus acidophilus]|nr:hypothetical protein CKO16_22065 [Rhodoblastus acidophilus]RAI16537.1 hypothetical protein CH337_20780 [Rhodoblastus acidophilus]
MNEAQTLNLGISAALMHAIRALLLRPGFDLAALDALEQELLNAADKETRPADQAFKTEGGPIAANQIRLLFASARDFLRRRH